MMKKIGWLGGMSWESTASYYIEISQAVKAQLGGLHSAKLSLYSVDFSEIEALQHQGLWQDTAAILSKAAQNVESGGADFLLICTNTMHKVAHQIQSAVPIPLLHIADATAKALVNDGIPRVGLLGTRFTMEQDFYKKGVSDKFGIEVVVPNEQELVDIHNIIYNKLCLGEIKQSSRVRYLEIIDALR